MQTQRHLIGYLITVLLAALLAPVPAFAAVEDVESMPDATASATSATSANEAFPAQELTPKIFYEFLLAEIALGRGQIPISAAAYADLAKTTRDPRIARRAAEVAFYARQPGLSLDAAKIWAETAPDSVQARQAYWTLLGSTGKADELAAELSRVVAAEATDATRRGVVLMQMGRLLSQFDDKKMAANVANKITEPYLSLPEAHFVRAQAAYSNRDDKLAMAELDQALTIKPDWEPAAILKAQLLIANPTASIDLLATFIKKYPKASDARLAYARALIEGKRYDEARAQFDLLLKAEPERLDLIYSLGLLSLQSGDAAKAEGYLKSLLDKEFPEKDSVHFYLGQIAEESDRTKEAIEHYDAITPGSQHQLQGQIRSAVLLSKSGQMAQALDRLHVAQVANPKERSNLQALEAQLLGEKGRYADAYQLLTTALQKNPDDPVLLYESALYAERLGKVDVLERNLRKTIKLKPDAAHAYNALGYSFADRNIHLDEANTLIDKALAMAPDDAAILDSKGWVNYRRGDLAAAIEKLQKALAVRPDPEIAAHLGEVQWQMGRKDEASKTWDAALKLAPDNDVLNSPIKRLRNIER